MIADYLLKLVVEGITVGHESTVLVVDMDHLDVRRDGKGQEKNYDLPVQ